MNWKDKALDILKESLTPIPHEVTTQHPYRKLLVNKA